MRYGHYGWRMEKVDRSSVGAMGSVPGVDRAAFPEDWSLVEWID